MACRRKGCLLAKSKKSLVAKGKGSPLADGKELPLMERKGHQLGEWIEAVKVSRSAGANAATAEYYCAGWPRWDRNKHAGVATPLQSYG